MTQHATARAHRVVGTAPLDRRLARSHALLLETASGIDPDVIAMRDPWTAIAPAELAALGFSGTQQQTPALVLPVWSVHGKVALYQARPDRPRTDADGKAIKYETPAGARMVLDVHPRIRAMLRNPQIPLYITEGIRKGDAAVSRELCCVALLGVTNWRGMNASGGKTALACWQSIALNGRTTYIAFDSDSATNTQVLRQAIILGEYLESKGADVQIVALPAGDNGAKVGLDDYFVAGGSAAALPTLAEPLKKVARRLRAVTRDATAQDYVDALAHLGYTFRLNECSDMVEVNATQLSDALAAKIRSQMEDCGYEKVKRMEDAYVRSAYDQRYHPIRDYLTRLEWDGKPHIDTLATYVEDAHAPIHDASGAEASVFGLWLRRWMIGAVAKVLDAEQNIMLVLDGPQGIGKSEFVRWLASGIGMKYYIEAGIDPNNKDTFVNLLNYFIWEVGELGATTRRADVEALKDFITKRHVTVRPAYARHAVHKPAAASLIGTINNDAGFLNDPTGSRRYIVVTVQAIDWAYTSRDVDQLWAEAVARYRSGEDWRIASTETIIQQQLNQEYELADPVEDLLVRHFIIEPDGDIWIAAADILEQLAAHGLRGPIRANQMAVASAARRLGLRKDRVLVGGQRQYGYRGIARRSLPEEDLPG